MQNHGYSSLLRKVTGVDLFAAEAHFHKSCLHTFYSKYQSITGYHQSTCAEAKETQEVLSKAHTSAYDIIRMMIQKDVIGDHKVLPLSVLREKYIRELEKQNQPNENYRSENLKKKLEKDTDISPLIE